MPPLRRRETTHYEWSVLAVTFLSISIVTYFPDLDTLSGTLGSLDDAVEVLCRERPDCTAELTIVDNSVSDDVFRDVVAVSRKSWCHGKAECRQMGRNTGYGAGHNGPIHVSDSRYYLVLNSDVLLQSDALLAAVEYMEIDNAVGLLTPYVSDGRGHQSFLAKRLPTVFDLVLRGFGPSFLQKLCHKRLERYEMRDVTGGEPVSDIPVASGCFMFFRTSLLQQLGGFNTGYFMYFEDFDLCMRVQGIAGIAYVPQVKIVHYGGNTVKKGWKHIQMFSVSAFRFFNRWGWNWI